MKKIINRISEYLEIIVNNMCILYDHMEGYPIEDDVIVKI